MLRASSSGIVLLKQCFSESQKRQHPQRVVHVIRALQQQNGCCCYGHFHTHAPANSSSSFSARFGSDLSSLVGPNAEGEEAEGVGEGEKQREGLVPPGLGLDAKAEREQKMRMRYHYVPWARPPPLPPLSPMITRRVIRPKDVDGVAADTRTRRKSRLAGKRKAGTPLTRRHFVKAASPRKRRPRKVGGERGGVNVLGGARERDAVDEALLQHAESSNLEEVIDDGQETKQERSFNVHELQPEEGFDVDDLTAEQLRAIILDKNSDLMGLTWDAYHRLVSLDSDLIHGRLYRGQQDVAAPASVITPNLLTRLANRLIAQRKHHQKNLREIFLRLLSVYARLRKERARGGGVPYLKSPEWNCLIHFAGTGLRRTSLQAYNASLDVFADMLRGVEDARAAGRESLLKKIEPNIYTYTSLLNIALRTEHPPAIEHAMNLLRESGKEPTRITHLCMMRFRHKHDGLPGLRVLLSSLKPEDVGADGVSAYMVCAGDSGNLDVVRNVYDALRRNLEEYEDGTYGPPVPENQRSEGNSTAGTDASSIDDEKYMLVEGILLPRTLVPSASIYHYTIQIFAYHGHLSDALQVFMDMLATRHPGPQGTLQFFQPSYQIFRGLFLGFARHGCRTDSNPRYFVSSSSTLTELSQIPEWNWDRFSVIFDSFIEYADSIGPPSERMVYWIMIAVRRMTNDERLLRDVWRRLNERWYIRKGGRLKTLDIKYGQREVVETAQTKK